MNLTRNHEVAGLIPSLAYWVKDLELVADGGLDLALLWHRPAATVPIRPLAWEPLYAADVALKRQKKKKKKEKKKETNNKMKQKPAKFCFCFSIMFHNISS